MNRNYYRKHLKINTSPNKEAEKKDDNIVSNNNNEAIDSKEENLNLKRRMNTDINDNSEVQNNPIYFIRKPCYHLIKINRQDKEKEKQKQIIGNEIENKEIQNNNRMKICEKRMMIKPSLPELNSNIFSNRNQNGIIYYNSTKNSDNKRFEYPENINKFKLSNDLYKNRKINCNQDNNIDNNNDNDNFNVFGGNDNLEENLNINEIRNNYNKQSINNKNEIENNLNIDENIMNKKENSHNKNFERLRNKIDGNIQRKLVHYNSNKNVYLKENSENNNNKIVKEAVKEVETKNNKSPIRKNKILPSEVLKTVDNQENRQKKFRQKFQLNSNLKRNYIKPKNYISNFPRDLITNRLININKNQKTYNKNNIDEENKSKKDYIENQNKDYKIVNNDKKINNIEFSFENRNNILENNDKKIKKNNYKIENRDNNSDFNDIKIKNYDYKSENKYKRINKNNNKVENRDNNINNNDIKIENNDIKSKKKINKIKNNDIKIKNNDIKIENRDIKIENKDIKIENKDIKIENKYNKKNTINYILDSIFSGKNAHHDNIKNEDPYQKNNNKNDNIIDNTNNNIIDNNHNNNNNNNNKIKISKKISDEQAKIGKNKNICSELLKTENNKNITDNNNKNEFNIHNNKIVDLHKIDKSNLKNDNKKVCDIKIDINRKINNSNKNKIINNNIESDKKNKNEIANNDNKRKKINNENNNNDIVDDINVNLNVNEILKNKSEKNSKKEEQEPKKNLINNKISQVPERKYRRIRYTRSYSNFEFLGIPCNCRLFKTINIFNSLLIMLNNISNINDYFDEKIINEINDLNNNKRFNLITIFFNLNKLFWNSKNDMNISESNLIEKYDNFIFSFREVFIKKAISLIPFYNDVNKVEEIIKNIYFKLNDEFTQINNKINKANDYIYNPKLDALANYNIKRFFSFNNSIISHDFTGFYQKTIFCENCQIQYARFNMIYNKNITFDYFVDIKFDLNDIFNNMKNQKKINLDSCFYYTLQRNNFNYSFCSQCHVNGKREITSIISAPNILTIILSNNENYNFALQEELDLKKYSHCYPEDGVYLLMSVLCQLSYNGKFIIYCINPKNSSWYSYSDGKIKKVYKMDINAIPLVLIYQIRGTLNFEYESLNWDEDKIKITVKFQIPGFQQKDLFFSKTALIKDVIKDIISIFDLNKFKEKNEIILLVNGGKADNDELLINALEGNNNVLIIMRKK